MNITCVTMQIKPQYPPGKDSISGIFDESMEGRGMRQCV